MITKLLSIDPEILGIVEVVRKDTWIFLGMGSKIDFMGRLEQGRCMGGRE